MNKTHVYITQVKIHASQNFYTQQKPNQFYHIQKEIGHKHNQQSQNTETLP